MCPAESRPDGGVLQHQEVASIVAVGDTASAWQRGKYSTISILSGELEDLLIFKVGWFLIGRIFAGICDLPRMAKTVNFHSDVGFHRFFQLTK